MKKLFFYFIKKKIYFFLILISFIVSFLFIAVNPLKIDGSIEEFLIQNDPEKIIYENRIKLFGSDNSLIITIGDNNLFSYEKLSKIRDLIFKLKKINGVLEVNSLFNQKNIISKKDGLYSGVFIDPYNIPKNREKLLEIKKEALSNPLVKGIFISKDGKYIFLNVRLKNDRSSEFSKYITKQIENILSFYKKDFKKLNQFGFAYINTKVTENIIKDLTFTIPLAIMAIIIVLYLNLKNLNLTLIPIITALLSIIITLGIMEFLNIKITILTSLVPVLIILIGSTEDSHIISEYLNEVQYENNRSKKRVILKLNKFIFLAIILTFLTTIIGFASIYLNEIKMLKEFSLAATIGLIVNFIITIIIIPNYLYALNINKIGSSRKAYTYSNILKLVEKFFYKGKNFVIFILFLIIIFSLYFIPKITIDNNILNYFSKSSEVRKEAEFLKNHLYGAKIFYITFETDKKGAFKKYKYLHQLEKIKHFIVNNSKFNFAVSLNDYISIVNRAIHNNDNRFYKVPKNNFLIKQYFLFFYQEDLKHYVTSDYSKANMIVWHNIFSSNEFNKEKVKLENFIKNDLKGSDIKFHIVGQSILISKAATTIAKGEIDSVLVTLLVSFILITIVFRHIKPGILIVIVNIIPILVVFILVSILKFELNMVTAMVAAISFGIIVDDTLHMLLRFNYEHKKHNIDKSILITIKKEGRAVILTSVYLTIGFLFLLNSAFIPVREYAFLTICIILVALLSDLFILPILLKVFMKEL